MEDVMFIEDEPPTGALHREIHVAEQPERLVRLVHGAADCTAQGVADALRRDDVVLIQGLDETRADGWMASIANAFGFAQQLQLQAQYASVMGHRKSIGAYFMTVNERDAFQFVTPHSEGNGRVNMQLAAFYCKHNSTDGGDNILLNTDSDSPAWKGLRELRTKVDLGGRKLSLSETARAKIMFGVNLPGDLLAPDDQVVAESESPLPGTRLFKVLAPVAPAASHILGRSVNVFWNSISSIDFDAGQEFMDLLRTDGLLKTPPGGADLAALDHEYVRYVWRSGVRYESLFKAKLTCRLAPGELVVMNNMTWTHSTSNWTPGSGTRDVRAAFA